MEIEMITLILVLALVGFLVWALTTYVPMPQPFKVGIYVIALVLVVIYVMHVLGIPDIPVR